MEYLSLNLYSDGLTVVGGDNPVTVATLKRNYPQVLAKHRLKMQDVTAYIMARRDDGACSCTIAKKEGIAKWRTLA